MTKDVFARRTFEIDGREIECRFFRPEEDEGNYFCRYEIDFPNTRRSSKAGGIDEVQAVLLAMQKAHTDLLAARENDGRQIAWLNDRSLGLPVNEAIRDWAGDDRF